MLSASLNKTFPSFIRSFVCSFVQSSVHSSVSVCSRQIWRSGSRASSIATTWSATKTTPTPTTTSRDRKTGVSFTLYLCRSGRFDSIWQFSKFVVSEIVASRSCDSFQTGWTRDCEINRQRERCTVSNVPQSLFEVFFYTPTELCVYISCYTGLQCYRKSQRLPVLDSFVWS